MAKLLLVRHNGWLAARLPVDGDGMVFTAVMARSTDIPIGENHPETVALPLA